MANINLLPWREWERERKKKEFLAQLGTAVVVALVAVLGFGHMLDTSIDGQQGRNEFMEKKIKGLDKRIAEIRDLRKQREDLLARMQVIQELQGKRDNLETKNQALRRENRQLENQLAQARLIAALARADGAQPINNNAPPQL